MGSHASPQTSPSNHEVIHKIGLLEKMVGNLNWDQLPFNESHNLLHIQNKQLTSQVACSLRFQQYNSTCVVEKSY
jgi:hypothetical protein